MISQQPGIVFFIFTRMHEVDVVVEWNMYKILGKFREIPHQLHQIASHQTLEAGRRGYLAARSRQHASHRAATRQSGQHTS